MPNKKIKIAVLMGGPSAEREISLVTGKAILTNLDKIKYASAAIEMGRGHKFYLLKNKNRQLINLYDFTKFDLIFIALHGTFGEDGGVQGMIEALGVKYTGSDLLSSALAMNKVYANQIYFANGLPFPQFVHFKKDGWKDRRDIILSDIKNKIGFPCVVKPVDQGSAVGVSIVRNELELIKTINKTIKKFPWLMAQKFIKGKEATCGVLEKDGAPMTLPPTRIIPNLGEFYDYKSKYAAGGSSHVCPADFDHEVNHHLQELALKAHIALGCRGMSRTDIFVADDGGYYILETNTIPGMTKTSLFPEAAKAAGIPFSEMLDLIIKASL